MNTIDKLQQRLTKAEETIERLQRTWDSIETSLTRIEQKLNRLYEKEPHQVEDTGWPRLRGSRLIPMKTTDQIKQQLAECIEGYTEPNRNLIRDALAVIEQQEQQIAQQRSRIKHWFKDASDACDGKYGDSPQGHNLEYWFGRKSVLAELEAFYHL